MHEFEDMFRRFAFAASVITLICLTYACTPMHSNSATPLETPLVYAQPEQLGTILPRVSV